jgi:hypothetical protein
MAMSERTGEQNVKLIFPVHEIPLPRKCGRRFLRYSWQSLNLIVMLKFERQSQ